MKKLTLFIVLVFISYSVFAQDTVAIAPVIPVVKKDSVAPRNFSIGIMGGYTYLMGNLAGINYADVKSGYSSFEGYNLAAEGTYWLTKRFGIGAMLSHSSFYAAQTGLADLAVGYQQSLIADSVKASSITKYNFFNLFVGPYFSFPLKNKRFNIDVRAVGGLTYANTPDFNFVAIVAGVPHPFSQNASAGFSYGFQGGAGFGYSFGEHVGIKLHVDYYYTNPNIKILDSNFPANAGRQITEYHQPVTMIHFNLGVVYKLSKTTKNVVKY
jgi:hypothetical protein